MFNMTQELVNVLGIDPERMHLEWISSAEGTRFAQVARDFTEQIKSLGPSSLKMPSERMAAPAS
jgi:F420-non-reducing hydrogenase iron-sulfur subunit